MSLSADVRFDLELKAFHRQVAEATQFLYAQTAINHVASRNRRTLRALNVTPMFWNTVAGALQYSAIVALGRVFDQKSPHNVDSILRFAEHNRSLFSKDALAARKRQGSANADDWLAAYMMRAYVPTTEDFRRLRRFVKRHRTAYTTKVRDLRHKHFAHTEVIDEIELSAMFARATWSDVERLIVFLNQLHEALWQLFHNGRRPRLWPMPRSARGLVRRRFDDPRNMTVQERIVTDVRRCLRALTAATPPPPRRRRFAPHS